MKWKQLSRTGSRSSIIALGVIILLMVVVGMAPAARNVHAAATSGLVTWSDGYYTGWQQAGYPPSRIPWNAITDLIQFSVMTSPNRDGSIDTTAHSMTPASMQAAVAAAHQAQRKILLSIGGAEDNNWDAACSSTNRATFISNLVALMRQYGYDGIDLDIEQDWQSPTHPDYIACVSGIRSALNQLTPRPLLTEAADPDWQAYMLVQVYQYLDHINLMSYGADATAIATGLNNYTSRGIPRTELGVGIGIDNGGVDSTNPADCAAKAQYVVNNGYGGVMEWDVAADAALHNGATPCFDGITPYVPAAGTTATTTPTPVPPTGTSTPTKTPVPPTPTSTPTSVPPTPTNTPPATPSGGALVLYDNAVAPSFRDGSFGYSSRNACDTALYYSPPCSYAIAYTAWGGVDFQVRSGSLSTAGYRSLQYKLNPNGQPLSDFGALFTAASGGVIKEVALSGGYATPLSGGWVQVSLPISLLNPANVALGTIQLKNERGVSLATVHYDDVSLTP
ncbi:MAG: hypothetical protein JOZ41_01080 [Chloroflexi bacterium]|nr:hypothetical protein [Chloroflexota bacterium]